MKHITYFVALLSFFVVASTLGYTASDSEGSNIAKHAESLLIERKFDELEKLAVDYRREDSKTRGGVPKLYFYYAGLSSNTAKDLLISSISDDERQALLNKWLSTNPNSVVARIVLSDFWMKLAWQARGGGFTNTVTDSGWKTFHEYVSRASSFLNGIDAANDPMAYYQQIEIARDSSAPRQSLDSLYTAAISKFPSYYEFYIQRAILLQEKWHGEPGEFVNYVNSLLKLPDRDTGLIAYSFVVVNTINSCDCNSNEIFRSIGLSWEPTKQGFDARLKKYGLRNRDWNQLALLAALAGQPTDAKIALDHIIEWDPPIWKSRENYDRAIEWVRSVNIHPVANPQPHSAK